MSLAYEQDQIAIRNKKPAIFRLKISRECYNQMKKLNVQEKFLELGGSKCVAQWLDMNVDGKFPNINLVEGLL